MFTSSWSIPFPNSDGPFDREIDWAHVTQVFGCGNGQEVVFADAHNVRPAARIGTPLPDLVVTRACGAHINAHLRGVVEAVAADVVVADAWPQDGLEDDVHQMLPRR